MGRYVRSVLLGLAAQPDVELTLLVRDLRNAAAYRTIVPAADVRPFQAARTRTDFAAVWYPWNGIRFPARAPAVVTINDDFAFAFPATGRIARWREQGPIRRGVAGATEILTISDWASTRLVDRFALDPQRISVIPLAPDGLFAPGHEPSPYSEPFVLAVGTGEKRKNVGFLIDAFSRAFPANDVRLVLVGKLDSALRSRARAANVPIVELRAIDDNLLRQLYRTAAAIAVPSLAEGFGLVAAEALACGAAVIAANTAALPEAVGNAGILLDPRDLEAWTAGLRELVRNAALNAYYRLQAAKRWTAASPDGMTAAVRAALELAIHNRV